jgi:peptide/nickel transport system substrate-binding protein
MFRSDAWLRRAMAIGVTFGLVVAACGGGTATPTPGGATPPPGATEGPTQEPSKAGGTIYLLTNNTQYQDMDPQIMYTGEDLAFFGATIMRSLTSYVYSDDPNVANGLQPDMATDIGRANADATVWEFTLKDGMKWEDGSPVTCEDVKYGISRTFANDITGGGPTYAVTYLDIPKNPVTDKADPNSAYLSAYYGPYNKTGQDLYDQAVVCDGNTITFHLNQSVGDWNYAVTLGMSAVPEAADTGALYTDAPMSNGPYKISEYTKEAGGSLVLVRNDQWDPATDSIRKAYPDSWVTYFGLDPKVIDQRLITSQGDDTTAVGYGIQPENLPQIFADPNTANPDYASRSMAALDPYSRYYWIDNNKVSNLKHRQAMAAALDRDAIRANLGGDFVGDLGDGVIKPNLGVDYAPSGIWDGLLGQAIPDTGDPDFAKQLIAESGEPMPDITWDYPQNATRDQEAAIVVSSMARAGINVTANPIPGGQYYGIVFDDAAAHEFGWAGWGPDWPNASTIIPPLFTYTGGWNLSRIDDGNNPGWEEKVSDAIGTLDRSAQAAKWQALNKEAMANVFVIPTTFGRSYRLAGTKIGPVYFWAPYGSWPYAEMYVTP